MHTFKYRREVKGYKNKAKRKLGFIADEVDPLFMDAFGKTIDQVSVNGMLIASIQAQQKMIKTQNSLIAKKENQIKVLKKELALQSKRIARIEKALKYL